MDIEGIIKYLAQGNTLTVEDRGRFQITSVEQLIKIMSQQGSLFHGTRAIIGQGTSLQLYPLGTGHRLVERQLERAGTPAAFAANYPVVLLIKALFSNKYGLNYGYGEIKQLGLNRVDDGVVNERGFIYLLNNTSTFKDTFYSPWEKYTTQLGAEFGGAITVNLDDLPQTLKVLHQGRELSREDLWKVTNV